MVSFADKPILDLTTPAEWEQYLAGTPDEGGVRLLLRKKNSALPGIERLEALEVALCFGWIDGQSSGYDENFQLQSYTPRRRASPWSKINIEHVERLIATGRMRPAGHAEIQRAQADGRWDAAYRQRDEPVPDDFRAALEAVPAAAAHFATLTGSSRFAFLFRLGQAKRAETRARRIAEYVALLAEGGMLR